MKKPTVPVKYRISGMTKALLLSFAFISDGIQVLLLLLALTFVLIPISYALSLLLTLLTFSIYSMVFISKKVNPFGGRRAIKKLTVFAGTFVAESIPVLGEFIPSLVIWTYVTIRQSRHEDIEKAERDAKIREEQERKRREMMQRRAEEEAQQILAYQQARVAQNTLSRVTNDNRPIQRQRFPVNDNKPTTKQRSPVNNIEPLRTKKAA